MSENQGYDDDAVPPEQTSDDAVLPEQSSDDAVLPDQTSDETDRGWGDDAETDDNDERLENERPPHW